MIDKNRERIDEVASRYVTSARLEALEKILRKIENAYFDRCTKNQKDYPPFKIDPFNDRAVYHQFIIKLIDEEIAYEKGGVAHA